MAPAIDLLFHASALPLKACPSLRAYRPRSEYVDSNLPAAIGQTCLDLRLLSGHLNNPNESSPVAAELLDRLKRTDKESHTNPRLLLGGHGFGKSKTLFDLATRRFVLLLDCSSTGMHVSRLFDSIDEVVATHKQSKEVRDCCFCTLMSNFCFALPNLAWFLVFLESSEVGADGWHRIPADDIGTRYPTASPPS